MEREMFFYEFSDIIKSIGNNWIILELNSLTNVDVPDQFKHCFNLRHSIQYGRVLDFGKEIKKFDITLGNIVAFYDDLSFEMSFKDYYDAVVTREENIIFVLDEEKLGEYKSYLVGIAENNE